MIYKDLPLTLLIIASFYSAFMGAAETCASSKPNLGALTAMHYATQFAVAHDTNTQSMNLCYVGNTKQNSALEPQQIATLCYNTNQQDFFIIHNNTISESILDSFVVQTLSLLKKSGITAIQCTLSAKQGNAFIDKFGFKIRSLKDHSLVVRLELEVTEPASNLKSYYRQCCYDKKRGAQTFRIQDNGTTLAVFRMPIITPEDDKPKKPTPVACLDYDYALLKNLIVVKAYAGEHWDEYLILKALKKLHKRGHSIAGFKCSDNISNKHIQNYCAKHGFIRHEDEPNLLLFDFKSQKAPDNYLTSYYKKLNAKKEFDNAAVALHNHSHPLSLKGLRRDE